MLSIERKVLILPIKEIGLLIRLPKEKEDLYEVLNRSCVVVKLKKQDFLEFA